MERKFKKIVASGITVLTVLTLIIAISEFVTKHSKKNYSGAWSMTSEIEAAQRRDYLGLKINWILNLSHSDDKLVGTGEKISENSNMIDFKRRPTISLQGSVEDNSFVLTFIERGASRETSGIINGEFSDDKFIGTFSSTASDSKGKITGYKIP